VTDAGESDAGELDAGAPDGGPPDAGQPDAGSADAGLGPDFVVEGFGAATKGGWQPGYDEFIVTSLMDSGPGTLREGLSNPPGPRIIRFALDGTIALGSSLLVPSNVTIDGRGHSITLTNKGLILAGSDDVIITNLAIVDVGPDSEDGLRIGDPTLGPSERVVIDHVTFRATGSNGDSANTDEAISIIFGSRDITLAWLRFENWEKVLLVGNGDAPQAVDSAITVSWHHSYFRSTGRRHPQARFGTVDVWNVFLDDWHMYDWFFLAPYRESFGAQSQEGARVRVESSLFKRAVHPKDTGSTANDATRCESNGRLDGVGLVTTSDSTAPLVFGAGCSGSTGWVRPYPITLDAADQALRSRLESEAGNSL
jgi:pectate lyase